MDKIKSRKIFVFIIALSGIFVDVVYSVSLLSAFFKPLTTSAEREFITSAIGLEIGWIALLIWMLFKPFERRIILLFTIIPVMMGNIFHSLSQNITAPGAFILNTFFGLLYSGLYVIAYFFALKD